MSRFSGRLAMATLALIISATHALAIDKTFEIKLEGNADVAATQLARNLISNLPSSGLDDVGNLDIVAEKYVGDITQKPVLIARIQDSLNCGSLGCLTFIFQFRNNKWDLLLDGNYVGHVLSSDGTKSVLYSEDGHGRKKVVPIAR